MKNKKLIILGVVVVVLVVLLVVVLVNVFGGSGSANYNNPLVCSVAGEEENFYNAQKTMEFIYDYDDAGKELLSLTSHEYIIWDSFFVDDINWFERAATIPVMKVRECWSSDKEYSGVSKSCKVKWYNDYSVVITVKWDIDDPDLDYGQELSKDELKYTMENISQYAGSVTCK